jgi:undecaprenyl-diphosphatase
VDYSSILLALLQGLFEWWPISSSGVVLVVSVALGFKISAGYTIALSLHLGSGLAVFTLFWSKFKELIIGLFKPKSWRAIKGYYAGLIASIIAGGPLYLSYIELSKVYGSIALLIVSIGLILTSILLMARRKGSKTEIRLMDWIITGILQGIAS